MERKYLITQEQLEQIEHYKRMFELNADLVRDLCNSEKDDIVYVFELKDGKMTQISIGLENIEEANSFIETMKEGMYYKSMRPDCVLIAMQVLNFA